ncbi:MAG: glycosyltransferase family 9 protein [Candidatus Binatia bacterium]
MKDASITPSVMESSRLAVLFPGALGDFICCLPSLQVLARRAPVEVFARSEFAAIASENIVVRSLERSEISRLFTITGAADEAVRRFFAPYAAVYSWTGSAQRGFVASLQAVVRGHARVFPFRPDDGTRHQAEYYFCCVHAATSDIPLPTISISPEAAVWRKKFWQRHSLTHRLVLVIAPGSGCRAKNWPEQYFSSVAQWWRDHVRGVVVVLVGPVEEERGGFTELSAYGVTVRNIKLARVAALLGGSSMYLGNDSGITHLAAASGTQTVALFGPSEPNQWRPRGPKVTVLSRHEECLTCDGTTSHGCARHRCLAGLEPAAVINALAQLMDNLP